MEQKKILFVMSYHEEKVGKLEKKDPLPTSIRQQTLWHMEGQDKMIDLSLSLAWAT